MGMGVPDMGVDLGYIYIWYIYAKYPPKKNKQAKYLDRKSVV